MTGFFMTAGLFLERKGMPAVFQKKGKKKSKTKCTKFENILKKGNFMRATIACIKQLEYALVGNINLKQIFGYIAYRDMFSLKGLNKLFWGIRWITKNRWEKKLVLSLYWYWVWSCCYDTAFLSFYRNTRPEVFCTYLQNSVTEDFAKFTGKHLWGSPFLIQSQVF